MSLKKLLINNIKEIYLHLISKTIKKINKQKFKKISKLNSKMKMQFNNLINNNLFKISKVNIINKLSWINLEQYFKKN